MDCLTLVLLTFGFFIRKKKMKNEGKYVRENELKERDRHKGIVGFSPCGVFVEEK